MIALQIILALTATLGMVLCYSAFRRSREAYTSWRDGEQNGLGLQVAAHQVRVAVINIVIHTTVVLVAALSLGIMWTGWYLDQLDLVMLTGLSVISLLLMIKQTMYRYDYAIIMDHAMLSRKTQKVA